MSKGGVGFTIFLLLALVVERPATAFPHLWCKVNPVDTEAAGFVDLPVGSLHKIQDQSRAASILGSASYKAIPWSLAHHLSGGNLARKGSYILAEYTQPKWIGMTPLTKAEGGVAYSPSRRKLYLYNYSLSGSDEAFENIIVLIDIDKPVVAVSATCLSAA